MKLNGLGILMSGFAARVARALSRLISGFLSLISGLEESELDEPVPLPGLEPLFSPEFPPSPGFVPLSSPAFPPSPGFVPLSPPVFPPSPGFSGPSTGGFSASFGVLPETSAAGPAFSVSVSFRRIHP